MFYNKHYIRLDSENRVDGGISDAFEQPQEGDICICEEGSYQFRLFPEGDENPPLTTLERVHLWIWEGGTVRAAKDEEMAGELAEILANRPPASTSPIDQLRAEVDMLLIAELQREGIL